MGSASPHDSAQIPQVVNSQTYSPMHRPKAIIFDFDGVLVDTEEAIFRSWQTLFEREGFSLTVQDYAPCLGAGYSHFNPADLLEKISGKRFDWNKENDERRRMERELLASSPLMTGAQELLEWCRKQHIRTVIASSSSRSWVEGWLSSLNSLSFFERIFCRTDGFPVKPDPALFLAARDFLQLPNADCLIIEDSENGLLAARAAGIPSVAVPCRLTAFCDLSSATFRENSLSSLLSTLRHTREFPKS